MTAINKFQGSHRGFKQISAESRSQVDLVATYQVVIGL